jgi:TPR repeat protein
MSVQRAAFALLLLTLAACAGTLAEIRRQQAEAQERQQSCDAGDSGACYALALAARDDYANPSAIGYRQDTTRMLEQQHLERACELGLAIACLDLVSFHWNVEIVARYVQRSCALGSAAGCLKAIDHLGRPPTTEETRAFATRACHLDVEACPDAIYPLYRFDPARGAEVAATLLAYPCEVGRAAACARAADRCEQPELRDRLSARACDLGVATACLKLAKRWEAERPKDADALYRRACAAGDSEGCAEVGRRVSGAAGNPQP